MDPETSIRFEKFRGLFEHSHLSQNQMSWQQEGATKAHLDSLLS